VRAQGAHEVRLVLTHRRQDVRAKAASDLRREVPDSAAGSVNEHALAFLHLRRIDQALPGREPRERQRGRLEVAE
jgi:hypothetical protein